MQARKPSATFVIFDDTPGTIERSPGVSIHAIYKREENITINRMSMGDEPNVVPNTYVIHTGKGSPTDALELYRQVKALDPTHICYVGHAAGISDRVKIGDVVVGNKLFSYNNAKSIDKGDHWNIDTVDCSNKLIDNYYWHHKHYGHHTLRGNVVIGNGCSFSNAPLSADRIHDETKSIDPNILFIGDYGTAADVYKPFLLTGRSISLQ
jgi:hypothetical protein